MLWGTMGGGDWGGPSGPTSRRSLVRDLDRRAGTVDLGGGPRARVRGCRFQPLWLPQWPWTCEPSAVLDTSCWVVFQMVVTLRDCLKGGGWDLVGRELGAGHEGELGTGTQGA